MPRSSTLFRPGKSGNPGGRPKGLSEVIALAREHTELAITTLVDIAKQTKAAPAAGERQPPPCSIAAGASRRRPSKRPPRTPRRPQGRSGGDRRALPPDHGRLQLIPEEASALWNTAGRSGNARESKRFSPLARIGASLIKAW